MFPRLSSLKSKLFINGKWISPKLNKSFPVTNPATEQIIYTAPFATKEDIDLAVKSSRRALINWSNTTGKHRAEILRNIAAGIQDRKSHLTELETLDSGKPLTEAVSDVNDSIEIFKYCATLAEKLDDKQNQNIDISASTNQFVCRLRYEPVGVVAAIVPWNYPLLMSVYKVAPALAAGCTMILKPSEVTPITGLELGEICTQAGLPPGVLNIVTGDGPSTGEPLTRHKDVNKISFTGSIGVGRKLMNIASEDMKRITLELGGKSPLIVFDDASIEVAVEWIMMGIFFCAGQICSATSRLLVQEGIYPKLMQALKRETAKLVLGDGMDPKVNMGPVVNKTQYDKILNAVKQAVSDGSTLEIGGGRPTHLSKGYFIEPTILTNVPKQSSAWVDEIFGPVLSVRTFKTEQEAIESANDSEYGLAAGVMSENTEKCNRVANQLQAGTVWINCSQPLFPQCPFGGMKTSGIGRELGPSALDAYLESKQITTYVDKETVGWYITK